MIAYANSDEMKIYRKRIFECESRVLKARSSDIINLNKELSALILEMNNNMHLDFNLLNKLYNNAKECFELELVSEIVHYSDKEKDIKLYKLGTKRPL